MSCVSCVSTRSIVFFPPNVDAGVVIELEQVNYLVEKDMEEVEVCAVLVNIVQNNGRSSVNFRSFRRHDRATCCMVGLTVRSYCC